MVSSVTKAFMHNTPQDVSNHENKLLGLSPTQSYLLEKCLGLARAIAHGHLNCTCCLTDQQNAHLCDAT